MTLILNGTDNSATTPAVTGGTAGTSTGPYYPTTNQWAVSTAGTQALLINASQNVGIGTATPGYKLVTAQASGDLITSMQGAVKTWNIRNQADGTFGYFDNSVSAWRYYYDTSNNHIWFTGASVERARISSAGGFSVGTTSDPGAGAIYATGNITAYFSDDRLKTKLGNIQDALSKVKALSGFYYEANQTAQDLGYKPVREAGVSAQQVQTVMPEVVKPAPIDAQYLTVDYERLVPLLIEAIKELDAKVEGLMKA